MLSLFSSEPRLKTRNRTGYYSLLTVAQTKKSSRLKSLKLIRKGYILRYFFSAYSASGVSLSISVVGTSPASTSVSSATSSSITTLGAWILTTGAL